MSSGFSNRQVAVNLRSNMTIQLARTMRLRMFPLCGAVSGLVFSESRQQSMAGVSYFQIDLIGSFN